MKGHFEMADKIIQLLIRIAHLSEKLKSVTDELDKIYDVVGDQAFIEAIRKETEK